MRKSLSICRSSLLYLLALPLLLSLPAASAVAQPLVLSDPTPRTILVEFDEDATDLGAVGSLYGPGIAASYGSDGVTATISVPGAALEALVDSVFAGTATSVPGSFSDYVMELDVATGEVLAADVSGDIQVPILGVLGLTQTANSTTLAGYEWVDFFGLLVPQFCTSGAACTIVAGLAYDPTTGVANAVGSIVTSSPLLPLMFSPFGDVRLSEAVGPGCDVEVSQLAYTAGEQLVLSVLSFSGDSAANSPDTRLRLQLSFGAAFTASLIDAGPLTLPAAFALDAGPVGLFNVPASLPKGSWAFRCAVERFTTGEVIAEDVAPFTVE